MWSPVVLCFFVGFALASTNPGWNDNSEYSYEVRARSLASLHEVSNQYSGVLLKGNLRVQPKPDGKLLAQLSNAQYAQVHSHLQDGWNTNIADSELSYQSQGMSGKSFQIVMNNGIIHDLIVSKSISNWEANVLKSIVSQLQLNTNAIRPLQSNINILPDGQHNSAVFKTMEETVTGITETLYNIHPISEHVLQSKPWLAPKRELKGSGQLIEVVKHKNYSRSIKLPSYHYGFAGLENWKPATNQMGSFFIRDSVSRAILTGILKHYTLQNTYTVNEVIMSPTLNDKQKGSVVSMVNLTLEDVKAASQNIEEVSDPINLGGLVYTYDRPLSGSNSVRPEELSQSQQYENEASDEEYNENQRSSKMRFSRFTEQYQEDEQQEEDEDSISSESSESYEQNHPQIQDAPETPLLPFNTGYEGMSIKQHKDVDIKHKVISIAQEIADDLQDPLRALKQDVLSKYVTMSSLIRIMNAKELQQVARKLYSESKKAGRAAWTSFRDAVAECGTGPGFLVIQEWIQSQKIRGEEAALILTTMTNSVREPTLEYMKSYFELIKNSDVQSESILNETALLSYTNLVRRVFVDRKVSSKQFPVNSFGKFYTKEGKLFVKLRVILYLTHKLRESISSAETRNIHAYIRALGNVASLHSLYAFMPYLQHKKQASQFQRLMMVVAMDKIVETYPQIARAVLFKIYQNSAECQEVRVAAVYQLMRTGPPTDMLQDIASYTNIDTQEHVNAAVKSAIESAAKLQGDEYQYLRSSAQAAKPLLTEKTYGMQHGSNHLRSYVVEELNIEFKQNCQSFGSDDEFIPKGLKYSLRSNAGGLKRKLAHVQAIVSSVDDLLQVGKKLTSSYQEKLQKQKQHQQQQQQHPLSSSNIARALNLKAEEHEQLEGNLYLEIDNLHNFLAFDNNTINNLAEAIRKYEDDLKSGRELRNTKLFNSGEMALSFPTETGFPFLFTYDTPTVYQIHGSINGDASPQISQGNKLHKPDTVRISTSFHITVSSKVQGRLSFSTPYDHQKYTAGFDKKVQVHIPVYTDTDIDLNKGQMKVEVKALEPHKGSYLFYYGTWPYTSHSDIMNLKPLSLQPNTYYISQKNLRSYNQIVGLKETGIAVRVQVKHEREFIDVPLLKHLFTQHGPVAAMLSLWDDASIQNSEISLTYLPEQSLTRKLSIRLGYQQKYKSQSAGESNENLSNSSDWYQMPQDSDQLTRQVNFVKRVEADINNAESQVYDASIEFQGNSNIQYTVTGAISKSNIDPKSVLLMSFNRSSNNQQIKPYQVLLQAKSFIPNTNGLDLSYSMKNEPKADTEIQLSFGSTYESSSKVKAKIEFRRSEERKLYLQEQAMYKKCKNEMREGNYQLPACANATMSANLLDRVDVKVDYENLKPDLVEAVETVYSYARVTYYPSIQVTKKQDAGSKNQINVKARFDPDLQSVNVSITAQDEESTISNIPVNEWAKRVFVVQPVFNPRSRLIANGLGLQTYRPICVVDQNYASTFNNNSYPISIKNYWTVMFQYIPKRARPQQQKKSAEEVLETETENYVVVVRQNSDSNERKDVKIVLSSPETDFKPVDIELNPAEDGSSGPKAKVEVNNQTVQINDKQSHDLNKGYVQMYSLPNGEVKVEIHDAFYIIYDGRRAKLTVVNGKFRDSVRGMCGQFNDDKTTDFLTPNNCIVKDPRKFVSSYEVQGKDGQQLRQKLDNSPDCIRKEHLFVPVISTHDADSQNPQPDQHSSVKCTKFQTRYVEQDDVICFTIRPMPVCQCQQRGYIKKDVSVHCIAKSNVSEMWKSQIDKGASPDFSNKEASKTIEMEFPENCSE